MARSVTTSSLFSATAMAGRTKTFRHVTDSENARRLAAKQQIEGVSSPHASPKGDGLPVKRIKK